MPNDFPVHLQYSLSRKQRLVPHVILWGVFGPFYLLVLFCFLLFTFMESLWFVFGAILFFVIIRNYVFGFWDVALKRVREYDILIEPLGIGFLVGTERSWVPLDGVLSMREYTLGVLTIAHYNGTVISIPNAIIPKHCIEHIQCAIEGGWEYLQTFADEQKLISECRGDGD